jgi:hypothetical protein
MLDCFFGGGEDEIRVGQSFWYQEEKQISTFLTSDIGFLASFGFGDFKLPHWRLLISVPGSYRTTRASPPSVSPSVSFFQQWSHIKHCANETLIATTKQTESWIQFFTKQTNHVVTWSSKLCLNSAASHCTEIAVWLCNRYSFPFPEVCRQCH